MPKPRTKKPKIEFIHSERARDAVFARVDALNALPLRDGRGQALTVNVDGVVYSLRDKARVSARYVYWSEKEPKGDTLPKSVVNGVKKDFPGEASFSCVLFRAGSGGSLLAYPGSEDDFVREIEQAWMEEDTERELAPLLREEFKQEVHQFLSSRAMYAARGGKYQVREEMVNFARGYILAWEKFGGEKVHPRPYVLTPKYGAGSHGVAYVLTIPPKQLLQEAQDAFACQIVMKS
jgi:hypothetical protein